MILKAICSVRPSPTRSPKPVHPVTRRVQTDSSNIFPSKSSAANPELILSTQNSLTTEISCTALRPCRTTCRHRLNRPNGIPIRNAWTRLKCGSVGICGPTPPRKGSERVLEELTGSSRVTNVRSLKNLNKWRNSPSTSSRTNATPLERNIE